MNRLFLWNSILLYRLKSIAAQNNINAVTDRKQFTRLQENWSARVAESTISEKRRPTGYVWICSTFNREGKSACPSRQIPEKVLEQLSADVLKTVEFNVAQFEKQIEYIDIC